MKKYYYIVTLFTLLFSSCSLDNNSPQFQYEIMPITSVVVPEEFVLGNTYEISVSYNRPSDCYVFNDFVYNIDGAERTIAVLNTVYSPDTGCPEEPEIATADYVFTVSSAETHILKFFQGTDEQGTDLYHIIEVPVIID